MNPQTLKEYVVVQTPDEIDFWKTDRWQQFVASRGGAPHGYRIITTFNTSDELKDSPYQGSAGAVKILKQLCELKRYKDTLGKDSFYEKRQPELWKLANDFLNGIADSAASPAGDGWVSVQDMPMEMFEASNEGRSETYNITYLYNGTPHVSCGYLLYENWHWLENNKPLSKGFAVTYYKELPTPPNKSV